MTWPTEKEMEKLMEPPAIGIRVENSEEARNAAERFISMLKERGYQGSMRVRCMGEKEWMAMLEKEGES